jgi:hypothetical protein
MSTTCNPNTQHQTWARWVWAVHTNLPSWAMHDFPTIRANCTRWFSKLCRGGAAELNIEQVALKTTPGVARLVITLMWDNRQAMDPAFVVSVHRQVERFMVSGFGPGTVVSAKPPVILAGDREDGRPPVQWLSIPHIESTARTYGG